MTPEDFRAAGLLLFGGEWRYPMRELLDCSDRNLSRFATGSKPVGPDFEAMLMEAIRDRHKHEPTAIMLVYQRALGTNPAE